MSRRVPISEIKAMLQAEGMSLIMHLCPGGRREGNLWSAPNPTRSADTIGSFKVWLGGSAHGAWKEYDSDEKGDIIDLIAYVHGSTKVEAIMWARKHLGLETADKAQVEERRKEVAYRVAKRNEQELERQARNQARAFEIFRRAKSANLSTDPAAVAVRAYLASRAIDLDAIGTLEALEVRAAMIEHWSSSEWVAGNKKKAGYFGPAMVCAIRDAAGIVTGVHCTWLKPDGSGKAPVSNAKLMLGRVQGAVVRVARGAGNLTVEEAVAAGKAQTTVLTEGIEDAMSIALAVPDARVWAATSLSNLAWAPVHLACVKAIVVAADNDWAKPQAMEQLDRATDRLALSGKPLEVMRPPRNKKDFNDLLRG